MSARIRYNESTFPLDVSSKSLLHALQTAHIDFAAPCGGAGTCGKCSVWVRDKQGLRLALACQTVPTDDMDVFVETPRPLAIAESGSGRTFECDSDESGYGIAIDIGTTTVVARLHDLTDGRCLLSTSMPNPQVAFGADVIARISACQEGKLEQLTQCIVSACASMVRSLCSQAAIDVEEIARIAIAGNTVMESIAAGVDPTPIGTNPFIPLDYFGHDALVPSWGKPAYFATCLSGYVGGDITADLLACGTVKESKITLLLDLGTNGEMAMGSTERLITCATAAGPVFEGANICFGMPARSGAISHVRIEDSDIALSTIDDAPPFGICGTGIIDAVAALLDVGIIDETGYLCDADEVPGLAPALAARITDSPDGRGNAFILADGISLTQADVRNVQLAKAAICAGVETMLEAYGVDASAVETLYIAGGFGSFLDVDSAARIGLFPAELAPRAMCIGNAAIEGATSLLLSRQARIEAARIDAMNSYIELSTSLTFNTHYIDCMAF